MNIEENITKYGKEECFRNLQFANIKNRSVISKTNMKWIAIILLQRYNKTVFQACVTKFVFSGNYKKLDLFRFFCFFFSGKCKKNFQESVGNVFFKHEKLFFMVSVRTILGRNFFGEVCQVSGLEFLFSRECKFFL